MTPTHFFPEDDQTPSGQLRPIVAEFSVAARRLADALAQARVRLSPTVDCDGTCPTPDLSCVRIDNRASGTIIFLPGTLSRAKLAANRLVHLHACPPRDLLEGIAAKTQSLNTFVWGLNEMIQALIELHGAQEQLHGHPTHTAAVIEYGRASGALADLLPNAHRILSAAP